MRIAISFLASASYGAMTSARNLMSTIIKIDSEHKFLFLLRPEIFERTYFDTSNVQFEVCPMTAKGATTRILWEHLYLNKRLKDWKADILFINMGRAPLNLRFPYIIAPQNMEPLFYKFFVSGYKRRIKSNFIARWVYQSAKKAAGIVAVSSFVKETMVEKASIAPNKIRIIYPGCPKLDQYDQDELIRFCEEKGIEGNFILTASKFIPYSNLHRLIEGYLLASQEVATMPSLVVAGGDYDSNYRHQIETFIKNSRMEDSIKLLGHIPHHILIGLMEACLFFCFPSLLEAFPFTVLEGFRTGTCILSSSAPPMPEIGGDAAIYFNPYSVHDIAENLVEVVQFSEQEIELWKKKSSNRAQEFKWENHISSLIEMITQISLR